MHHVLHTRPRLLTSRLICCTARHIHHCYLGLGRPLSTHSFEPIRCPFPSNGDESPYQERNDAGRHLPWSWGSIGRIRSCTVCSTRRHAGLADRTDGFVCGSRVAHVFKRASWELVIIS